MDLRVEHTNKEDQISPEFRGSHLLGRRLKHSKNQPQRHLCNQNVINITIFFIAAITCIAFYHSAKHFQYFLLSSYNPLLTSESCSEVKQSSPSLESHSTDLSVILSAPTLSSSTGSIQGNRTSPPANEGNEEGELERVLNKAAMADKTVIITTLNAAWTAPNSIFDLFLESFRIGIGTKNLLNHLVVIALDQTAYSRCNELHPHCYSLTTRGVNFTGEAFFMKADYWKMMWRRIAFLGNVLEMGYNFIFTDGDVMWFRHPFSHFYPNTDFQISCDSYLYNSTDLNNYPNGGFNFVQSNNRTIQFYKFWYISKNKYRGKHDQGVLNMIKFDPFIENIGLSIRFLDTAYFGGFCEQSKDLNLVCTMHSNCCVGLNNKVHDLKMLIEDWRKYMEMENDQKKSNPPPTWTLPRLCMVSS